jgi:hypothetical protein
MHVPQNNRYEFMVWNQTRFTKGAFAKAMNAAPIKDQALLTESYMMTTGDRGSLIVDEVMNDGDAYKRKKEGDLWIYGRLSVLREFSLKGTFLTVAAVARLALAQKTYLRISRKLDGKVFEVALLSDWPEGSRKFCAAVHRVGSCIAPLNPEPPAAYNMPKDQFTIVSQSRSTELKDLLNALASTG